MTSSAGGVISSGGMTGRRNDRWNDRRDDRRDDRGDLAAAIASQIALEMLLVSSVTAPFRASALPSTISAPVFSVMLVSARIFPRKSVFVPRVAELPICQNTLQQFAPLLVIDRGVARRRERASDLKNEK